MALFFVSMMIVLSCVSVGQKTKYGKVDISVSVMEAVNSNSVFNTSHVTGRFGKTSLTGPVEGQLVHVHTVNRLNHTGCENYTHGVPTSNWVALVERGSCKFSKKVITATKRYNATAVIVYNNRPKESIKMKIDDESIREVYVAVIQREGKRLAQLVDSGLHVQVKITAAASCSPSPYSLAAWPILSSTLAMLGLYFAFGQSV